MTIPGACRGTEVEDEVDLEAFNTTLTIIPPTNAPQWVISPYWCSGHRNMVLALSNLNLIWFSNSFGSNSTFLCLTISFIILSPRPETALFIERMDIEHEKRGKPQEQKSFFAKYVSVHRHLWFVSCTVSLWPSIGSIPGLFKSFKLCSAVQSWAALFHYIYTLSVRNIRNTCSFNDRLIRWIQVKDMIPYWCHLLNPL